MYGIVTNWLIGILAGLYRIFYTGQQTRYGTVPTTADSLADNLITATAAAQKPLVIQGASGQSANLLELQNSAGTVELSVGPTGVITPAGGIALVSAAVISWNADTGLARNAAGIVEFNNGTKGTLRDLTCRSFNVTAGAQSILGAVANPADANADFIWTPSAAGKLFVFNTSSTQPLVVRQLGGGAGTNEGQAYHDGTNWIFTNKVGASSNIVFRSGSGGTGGGMLFQDSTGAARCGVDVTAGGFFITSTGALALNNNNTFCQVSYLNVRLASTGTIGFNADTGFGSFDTAIYRVAAGVVGSSSDGGTTKQWFQDSAGALALASPFTDATGTLAATNWSFPVISGRTYKIFGYIAGNNTTGTEGIQFDFNGGGATASAFLVDVESLGLGTVVLGTSQASALATALTATTFVNGRLRVTGYLVASSTGTIIVRAAEVSHAAGTLTVNAGSWMSLQDMRAV